MFLPGFLSEVNVHFHFSLPSSGSSPFRPLRFCYSELSCSLQGQQSETSHIRETVSGCLVPNRDARGTQPRRSVRPWVCPCGSIAWRVRDDRDANLLIFSLPPLLPMLD